MDPATIISLVGGCISLAKITVTTIHSAYELKDKFDNVEYSVQGLISKLNSIQFSLSMIENWARHGEGRKANNPELFAHLESSIRSCTVVISGINAKVSQKDDKPGVKDRLRFVWNDSLVKGFESDLDSQISAIQFLLITTQLYV
jgi:hypothetical protein